MSSKQITCITFLYWMSEWLTDWLSDVCDSCSMSYIIIYSAWTEISIKTLFCFRFVGYRFVCIFIGHAYTILMQILGKLSLGCRLSWCSWTNKRISTQVEYNVVHNVVHLLANQFSVTMHFKKIATTFKPQFNVNKKDFIEIKRSVMAGNCFSMHHNDQNPFSPLNIKKCSKMINTTIFVERSVVLGVVIWTWFAYFRLLLYCFSSKNQLWFRSTKKNLHLFLLRYFLLW